MLDKMKGARYNNICRKANGILKTEYGTPERKVLQIGYKCLRPLEKIGKARYIYYSDHSVCLQRTGGHYGTDRQDHSTLL